MCSESNAIAQGNWRNVGMIGYQIWQKYFYISKQIIIKGNQIKTCLFWKICQLNEDDSSGL